jgi:hypothetical protein
MTGHGLPFRPDRGLASTVSGRGIGWGDSALLIIFKGLTISDGPKRPGAQLSTLPQGTAITHYRDSARLELRSVLWESALGLSVPENAAIEN